MTSARLQRLLASASGYQLGEIDQRCRPLREHGFIPFGPRGSAAPKLDPLHCALHVLSMVSRRAADAGPVMVRAMDLKAVPRGADDSDHVEMPLAVLVTAGIVTAGTAFDRVDIHADGRLAWADLEIDGRARRVLFTDDDKIKNWLREFPDDYDKTGVTFAGHRFTITSALMEMIAVQMEEIEAGFSERKAS